MSKPKIVFWDLETLPNARLHIRHLPEYNSDRYGLTLKADVNSLLCFGYKLRGDKDSKCINVWDTKAGAKDINDDTDLCKVAYEVLKDADAIVTHNGANFDLKFLNTRLLILGMAPLPKIPHIDTCSLSKRNLYLLKNRLNHIAQSLSTETKMENGGWQLWERLSLSKWEGTKKQIEEDKKTMSDYCKQDVNVLEKIFNYLIPFATNVPNYNLFTGDEVQSCPACGSLKMYKHSKKVKKTGTYQRYQCQQCGTVSCEDNKGKLQR